MTKPTKALTAEELAELQTLAAEVDRLSQDFEFGGGKNMGLAQQLSYAEEALGRCMADHRHALLAMARELIRVRSAIAFLNDRGGHWVAGNLSAETLILYAAERGWLDPLPAPPVRGDG